MGKVAAVAVLTAVEGKAEELKAVLTELVAAVGEGEPGTVVYALHQDQEDANQFWFYELYADDEAAAAHSSGTALREVGGRTRGLVTGRPQVHRLTPVAAHGL